MAICVLVVLVSAPPAGAHAALLTAQPADREVLRTAPERLILRFSESVTIAKQSLKVLDGHGEVVVAKGAAYGPGGRDEVALRLPALRDGAYVATWRVISADSHPSVGALTFRIGDADDDFHIGAGLLEVPEGDRALGVAYGLARFGVYTSVVVSVGGLAFLGALWPAGLARRRPVGVVRTAWVAAVVTTAAAVAVQPAYAAGEDLGAVVSASTLADVLSERYGRAGLARLVLLGVLWALVLRRLRAQGLDAATSPPTRVALAAVLGGIVVTLASVGHAVAGRHVPLGFATDAVHLGAVSAWVGGLVMLVVVLAEARRGDAELAGVVRRFSTVAGGAVVVMVVTGSLQSWRQLDGLGDVTATTFGRLLGAKVALVAVVVAFGFASRRSLRAHFARIPVAVSPGPGAAAVDGDALLARRLRRSVGAEVVVAVAVLAVTAVLVNAVPGRSAAKAKVAVPFSSEQVQGDLKVIMSMEPALAGLNDVHVYTVGPNGRPVDPLEVTATLSRPSVGVGSLDVELVRNGAGHYSAFGFAVPMVGTWDLEVVAVITDFDELRYSAKVPVR